MGTGAMFDKIAGRYDLLNRVMSFGLDRRWRDTLVRSLHLQGASRVLDIATGTGDVALAVCDKYPETTVTGLDPSARMLEVAHEKVHAARLDSRVTLIEGDAQALPFEDHQFDACCISFGIRNVPNRLQGLREMTRVTRSGGRVVVLELGEPLDGLLKPLARFHVHHVVPRLGALLSGSREYRYLQSSIAAFPAPNDFLAMMAEAGLVELHVKRMSFGAAHLYCGQVP
jgi:demethylmenaquinone methyltransferase/2-methoxy-6-polyprenyl-1,4-benzoquinol methylase